MSESGKDEEDLPLSVQAECEVHGMKYINWNKLWCILANGKIRCFKNEKDSLRYKKDPEMEVDLTGATYKETLDVPPGFLGGKPQKAYAFCITTYKRVLVHFCCRSDKELKQWLNGLKADATAKRDDGDQEETKEVKIAIIGDSGCGKTSFLSHITEKEINTPRNSTGFSDYYPVQETIQGRKFTLLLADGSVYCQPNFAREGVEKNILNEVDGIFLCYDISSRESFENVDKKWKAHLAKLSILDTKCIILVGLKGDQPHAIDTSLIPMTKNYVDDNTVLSVKAKENVKPALEMITGGIMNRTAQRTKKLIDMRRGDVGNSPHKFELKYFKSFTWCDFCAAFIWGVASPQGYQCLACGYKSHKGCLSYVPHMCEGAEK